MQLNFLGLIVLGAGILALGLGITGNYGAFGKSVTASFGGGKEKANPPRE